MSKKMQVFTDHLKRSDIQSLGNILIEDRSLISTEFINHNLKQLHHVYMVAYDKKSKILGFIQYKTKNTSIQIIDVQIDMRHRRKRLASSLIADVKGIAYTLYKMRVTALIPERNLIAQLLFRSHNFKYVYSYPQLDSEDDLYKMVSRPVL